MLSDDLDNMIESARLLGRTEARKENGCYTPHDSRFCGAMYEAISKYRRSIEAAVRVELAKQEPVAWIARGIHAGKVIAAKLHDSKQDADNTASVFLEHYGAAETVPLYAAPVVQPDDIKDAARYRYMRSNGQFQDRNGPGVYWYLPRWNRELPLGERLDAAIDEAMGKEQS